MTPTILEAFRGMVKGPTGVAMSPSDMEQLRARFGPFVPSTSTIVGTYGGLELRTNAALPAGIIAWTRGDEVLGFDRL